MTLIVKGIVWVLFFSLIVSLLALLPSTADYPLPDVISQGVTLVVGYYFAWAQVFTFLDWLFYFFILSIFIEVYVWIAKAIMWTLGLVARLVG